MTTFQLEKVSDVLDEIRRLVEPHWHEVAHYQDIPLDPDYPAYMAADLRGNLRTFTARVAARLVGYGVFFIGNLHYRSTKIATQDVVFLLPEHRADGVGAGLLDYCDQELKAEGVALVMHHVKTGRDFSRPFEFWLAHRGYEPIDTVYGRRLDKE